MKLFLDTEFTALRQSAKLISLAMVSEEGRWFYAEFTDFPRESLSEWHREHVLPYLFLEKGGLPTSFPGEGTCFSGTTEAVSAEVRRWLNSFDQLEVWADAPAYDWVLFCELLGGSLQLPAHLFYLPFDLVTLLKIKGLDPDTKREELAPEWAQEHQAFKHNALYDACLLRAVYQKIGTA